MRLYLMRHGQTEGNVLQIAGLDPPLTHLGQQQIQRCAESLSGESITHLYCSPLYRAMQCADILRTRLDLRPCVHPNFCEIWGTGWNARTMADLQSQFPWAQFPGTLPKEPWWPQIAETAQEIQNRAAWVLHFLQERHADTDDRVCLIGHGDFGSALLKEILGIFSRDDRSLRLKNGSFSIFQVNAGKWQIESINQVTHLTKDLWTE